MQDFERRDLERANSLANWSFVGLVIPLVGWILAGLSKSHLKNLQPTNEAELRRIIQVRNKTNLSILLSVSVVVVTSIAFLAASVSQYSTYTEAQTTKEYSSYQVPVSTSSNYPAEYRSNFIQACLDSGGYDSYCGCALQLVMNKYTYSQALDLETTGYPTSFKEEVVATCI